MDFLKDRRTVLALAGSAVALVAGLSVAWILVAGHRGEVAPPPPASQAGLVIDPSGRTANAGDTGKLLRCFVNGQSAGEMTLADCARRNGVATDALDLGLDASGALAAGQGSQLTPLPPEETSSTPDVTTDLPPTAGAAALQGGPSAACWRFADNQWRKLSADLPLGGCVQALFAGHCAQAGEADYGRWGQQALRLVPGRVEISADNHSFRPLVDQGPACAAAG
jgi:hypothetical protein